MEEAAQGRDKELDHAFARGEESALAEAYRMVGPLVYSLALNSLGERSAADDVTQEVFIRAWKSRASYRPEVCPAAGVADWHHQECHCGCALLQVTPAPP